MSAGTGIGLVLALVSTTLTNLAYLREHDAAAELPVLCMRCPLQSARLLLHDRSWMSGFAMETAGFLLYALALALASLALVQSVAAGGIGILAYASARLGRRRLTSRESRGVILSVGGLFLLAVSLVGGSGEGTTGSTASILVWLGVTACVALVLVLIGRRWIGVAAAYDLAGGLFFSLGDVSTKVATRVERAAFVLTLMAGYTLGTARSATRPAAR